MRVFREPLFSLGFQQATPWLVSALLKLIALRILLLGRIRRALCALLKLVPGGAGKSSRGACAAPAHAGWAWRKPEVAR